MTSRTYQRVLIAWVILHWGIVFLFASGVIPQDYRRADAPFWMHQGGDNYDYHALASGLSQGELFASKYPLGYPVMLLPFIWLSGGAGHDALVQPVSAWWALVMMPIVQALLAWQAYRLTKNRAIAAGAVLIYTLLPIVVWGVLYFIWNPTMAELISVHMIGAQMLTDIPTTFLTLIAFVLYWQMRRYDDRWQQGGLRWALGLGVILGWLVLMRYSAAVTPIAFAFLLLIERRWRMLFVVTAVALVVFAPQMLYNQTYFGSPLTTGYEVLDDLPPEGLFSLTYLFEALGKMWERLGVGLIALGAGASAGVFIALRALWRVERVGALWVILWVGGYLVFYAPYYYSWTGAMGRFMIPVYPALALLGAVLLWQVVQWVRSTGYSASSS